MADVGGIVLIGVTGDSENSENLEAYPPERCGITYNMFDTVGVCRLKRHRGPVASGAGSHRRGRGFEACRYLMNILVILSSFGLKDMASYDSYLRILRIF